jgi:epoxide hydrolase 4
LRKFQPKTLIIWGELDKALEMEIAELSVGICRDAKLVKIPDSSHWVQQDVPQKVNAIMEEWLAEN